MKVFYIILQLDISPEEIGNNVPAAVGLVGDVNNVVQQVLLDLLLFTIKNFVLKFENTNEMK